MISQQTTVREATAELGFREVLGSLGVEFGPELRTYRNPVTGGWVGLYDGEAAGMDTEGGRWQTVCEDHGSVCSHDTLETARMFGTDATEWCEDCMAFALGAPSGHPTGGTPTSGDTPAEQEASTMAAKTHTARQAIEAAFASAEKKQLRSTEVASLTDADPKWKGSRSTIITQLARQSAKADGYVVKVKQGVYKLRPVKAAAEETQAPANGKGEGEVTPDPKPARKRARKAAQEPVAA